MTAATRPEAAIERLTVDGVDVLWARSSGPHQVDLVFRSGTANEPYAQGGLSHLIEHLAFFRLGEDRISPAHVPQRIARRSALLRHTASATPSGDDANMCS